MNKFFKDKKMRVLLILLSLSVISVIIASCFENFIPFSCIIFGISCLYGAYLMFLVYKKKKRNNIDEFISEEEVLKRKATQFVQSESKVNTLLLVISFLFLGVILIYYGLKILMI